MGGLSLFTTFDATRGARIPSKQKKLSGPGGSRDGVGRHLGEGMLLRIGSLAPRVDEGNAGD